MIKGKFYLVFDYYIFNVNLEDLSFFIYGKKDKNGIFRVVVLIMESLRNRLYDNLELW